MKREKKKVGKDDDNKKESAEMLPGCKNLKMVFSDCDAAAKSFEVNCIGQEVDGFWSNGEGFGQGAAHASASLNEWTDSMVKAKYYKKLLVWITLYLEEQN